MELTAAGRACLETWRLNFEELRWRAVVELSEQMKAGQLAAKASHDQFFRQPHQMTRKMIREKMREIHERAKATPPKGSRPTVVVAPCARNAACWAYLTNLEGRPYPTCAAIGCPELQRLWRESETPA
jgi:hypothetical protein